METGLSINRIFESCSTEPYLYCVNAEVKDSEVKGLNAIDFCRCPDNISAWDKMIYAAGNRALRAEFKGTKPFEYHDEDDFNFQEMVAELIRKDRQ